MASRLVLSTVGIKSPLDVGDVEEALRAAKRRAGDGLRRRSRRGRRRGHARVSCPFTGRGARFRPRSRSTVTALPCSTSWRAPPACRPTRLPWPRCTRGCRAPPRMRAPRSSTSALAARGGASPGSSATFAFPSSCVRASTSSHPRRAGACRAPRARTSSTRRFAGAFRSMPSSPRSLSPITPDALSARRRRRRLIPRSGSP